MSLSDFRGVLAATIYTLSSAAPADLGAAFDRDGLRRVALAALTDWDADVARVLPLFADNKTGHDYARLFDAWRTAPPSMASLLAVAGDKLGLDPAEPVVSAAMLAALAADVPLNNGYHDNHHFREVAGMMAVYCRINQKLAAAGKADAVLLSQKDMAKCLLAAIAHDLLHDGKGNTLDGVHHPYRLESKAIAAIEPYMALSGMDEADRADVRVLIRVTDVSAPKGVFSPHKILRALTKGDVVAAPAELSGLVTDARLRQMAAMMSDADLTPSAGLSYRNSRRQGKRLQQEVPALAATDETQLGFLNFVVEGSFLSAAALHHTQPNLRQIFDQTAARVARRDQQAGKPRVK